MLDILELKDALTITERLGYFVTNGGAVVADRDHARDAGFAAIADWPASIQASLDRSLAANRAAQSPTGLISSYCGIYTWARRCSVAPFGEQLRAVIRDHAIQNAVIARNEPIFGSRQNGTVTLTCAAKLLGQGFARARKVLQSEGLVHSATRRGVAAPIQMAAVRTLVSLRTELLNANEVGRMLGTARSQTREILSRGIVEPAPGLSTRPRYPVQGVDDFLRRLTSGVAIVPSIPAGLSALPGACKSKGIKLADACLAVLSRSLKVQAVLEGETRLGGLLVHARDLALLRTDRGMTMEAAAAILGIHHDAARSLIRAGALRRLDGRQTICVAMSSVSEFHEQFVTNAALARSFGTSPKKAARILAERGVEAAFGPPGYRQLIYHRAALSSVLTSFSRGERS